MSRPKYTLTKEHSNLFGVTLHTIWDKHNKHIMELDQSIYTRAWCVSDEYIMDHFVAESDDMDELIAIVAMEKLR
jgi:hypothetical protein